MTISQSDRGILRRLSLNNGCDGSKVGENASRFGDGGANDVDKTRFVRSVDIKAIAPKSVKSLNQSLDPDANARLSITNLLAEYRTPGSFSLIFPPNPKLLLFNSARSNVRSFHRNEFEEVENFLRWCG